MIEGIVGDALEAVITLGVSGTAQRSSQVNALIDTGYSGDVMLPTDVVRDLSLTWAGSWATTTKDADDGDDVAHRM